MRKLCYGLQFAAIIGSLRPLHSLPYLFDCSMSDFGIFGHKLLQPYNPERASAKVPPSFPALFFSHLALAKSGSGDIIDMLCVPWIELCLQFRVPHEI